MLVTSAASMAGLALLALTVGMPMLMNDIALLETEAALEHRVYLDMSNQMWTELMDQDSSLRVARQAVRERRQCKHFTSMNM